MRICCWEGGSEKQVVSWEESIFIYSRKGKDISEKNWEVCGWALIPEGSVEGFQELEVGHRVKEQIGKYRDGWAPESWEMKDDQKS